MAPTRRVRYEAACRDCDSVCVCVGLCRLQVRYCCGSAQLVPYFWPEAPLHSVCGYATPMQGSCRARQGNRRTTRHLNSVPASRGYMGPKCGLEGAYVGLVRYLSWGASRPTNILLAAAGSLAPSLAAHTASSGFSSWGAGRPPGGVLMTTWHILL